MDARDENNQTILVMLGTCRRGPGGLIVAWLQATVAATSLYKGEDRQIKVEEGAKSQL
jgi:hypothetical protein